MADPIIDGLLAKMSAFEVKVLKELAAECTHPIAEYTEERISRLVEQMNLANLYRWPSDVRPNL